MTDTPLEVERLYRELLMQRSGQERMMMASRMFDAARAMVLASLPPDLTEAERRVALFLRIYGDDFDPETRERICNRLRYHR